MGRGGTTCTGHFAFENPFLISSMMQFSLSLSAEVSQTSNGYLLRRSNHMRKSILRTSCSYIYIGSPRDSDYLVRLVERKDVAVDFGRLRNLLRLHVEIGGSPATEAHSAISACKVYSTQTVKGMLTIVLWVSAT